MKKSKQMFCYLICSSVGLTVNIGSQSYEVSHYIGFTNSRLEERLKEHCSGLGSKITSAFISKGGSIKITRFWNVAERKSERILKNYKNAKKLCPNCNPRAMSLGPRSLSKGEDLSQSIVTNDVIVENESTEDLQIIDY